MPSEKKTPSKYVLAWGKAILRDAACSSLKNLEKPSNKAEMDFPLNVGYCNIYIVLIHQSAVFLNVKPSWPCIRSEVMAAQRTTETPLNHTYFIGSDSKYTWAVFKRVCVFHYTHLVLSQILSRCFRDHTPGFRAMNIWQNCFRGAFAIFGKPIRSKQPVIHIYDMMHRYLTSVNQPLTPIWRAHPILRRIESYLWLAKPH